MSNIEKITIMEEVKEKLGNINTLKELVDAINSTYNTDYPLKENGCDVVILASSPEEIMESDIGDAYYDALENVDVNEDNIIDILREDSDVTGIDEIGELSIIDAGNWLLLYVGKFW